MNKLTKIKGILLILSSTTVLTTLSTSCVNLKSESNKEIKTENPKSKPNNDEKVAKPIIDKTPKKSKEFY
ncbi:hypothetical protein [Mycoplasma nasistruthionis]|uniref:Variable surface lipoprotein n=1 Tax=Mycoplasma nasistruthionis TaxID=353852 RepID=A0A4Y6I7E0_9MOLU|nr:hypothetical protein [Mycoplasma nasistruthionis]QDF65157.1 hypothetical protein FIV53_02575 [Mycoplasma nasistruthionis]